MRVVSARYRWVMSACQHSLGMAASKRMKELLGFFFGAGVMSPSFLTQEQGVKYVVNSDTSGRTNVKSRDIVSISMSRGSLRVGGSFLDFACVGVNGGDVVVDADEHDFFGAVFSSDVEFAH